jgi:hypothetical protein
MMLSSPVYQLPLTDDELILVGRITLVWAQIDFQIDGILTALHRLNEEQFAAFFGRMMIGGKVQAVRSAKGALHQKRLAWRRRKCAMRSPTVSNTEI